MKLRQKYFFASREFDLSDKSLAVKISTLKEKKEYSIKLEELGDEIISRSFSKVPGYIAASISTAIIIFMTFAFFLDKHNPDINILIVNYLLWIPLALFFTLKPVKKEIYITGGKYSISFYQDRPTKEELKVFIDTLLAKSKDCILDKYAKIDTDLPEDEQMKIFNWLKNKDIISQEKYEELKQEYKTKKLL